MSFIKTLLDVSVPQHLRNSVPTPVLGVFRKLMQQWQEHAQVINGGLEFGSPTAGPVNINGHWVTVVTPATPSTDFIVTHNLGRPVVNYQPAQKSAFCDVIQSLTVNSHPNTQVILQASVGNVTLTFFMY